MQFLFEMKPMNKKILINKMKNIDNQKQEAMITFIGQLISSKNTLNILALF